MHGCQNTTYSFYQPMLPEPNQNLKLMHYLRLRFSVENFFFADPTSTSIPWGVICPKLNFFLKVLCHEIFRLCFFNWKISPGPLFQHASEFMKIFDYEIVDFSDHGRQQLSLYSSFCVNVIDIPYGAVQFPYLFLIDKR
jgi:hypothetical protein